MTPYLFSNDPSHARPWEPRLGHPPDRRGRRRRRVDLDIKGGRHYTASQLLAGGFDLRTPPPDSATAARRDPRCGYYAIPSRGRPASRRYLAQLTRDRLRRLLSLEN